MSLVKEYNDKIVKGENLATELLQQIAEYNKKRGTYLFVYAAAIGKPIPTLPIEQSDYYIIRDLLASQKGLSNIDLYIETPGGSGETAEDIVEFLHNNFNTVSFVVSGEAKSAGTIMVLSGDEILMTETGSLGPIDAQMKIGRSIVSAYDYIEWINDKKEEAQKNGSLNPVDALMVAQITPGEYGSVFNALKFAEDLVSEWLIKYKFKKWISTETRKISVTENMKEKRAKEIANKLNNHSKWRSHGRSLKINDLEEIGLKITKVDADPILADIVYRIQTICRTIFNNSNVFKIFATQENKLFRQAAPMGPTPVMIPSSAMQKPDVAQVETKCPKCGNVHKIYAKFVVDPQVDIKFKNGGFIPFPKDAKIACNCGFEIDLLGIKNQLEIQTGRKILQQ